MLRTILCVAAGIFATAFAPLAASAGGTPGALDIFVDEDPASLDTILNTPYGWQLGPLTQGYLFLVDARGGLVPDRAREVPTRANGGISADGKTIAYRIRTGAWSDGAPFDAHDVAFTVSALLDPRTNVPDRSIVRRIASVAVPRPDRLVVRLREPWAPFARGFLTLGANDPFAILPRHVAARYSGLNASSLDTRPVGLGPYRLARWIRGERLEFERSPHYWRGPARTPRIVVHVVPSAQTRLVLARTGDLDLAYLSGLQTDEAARAGLRVVRATTNIFDYVQFNMRRPALRDVRVRRAIVRAIDRARIARDVYRGLEAPSDSGQLDPALERAGRLPAFDARAAAGLLRARGLDLDLAIAGQWRSSAAAAVALAAELGAAGVRTNVRTYGTNAFWGPASAGGIVERGAFDLALTSWSPSLDADRSYLFGCAALPPGGGNAGAFCDPAFDRAEAAGAATYDEARRALAYAAAQRRLALGVPVVPLGLERSAYAVSRRFGNFAPGVLGRDYWNAWEWIVLPTRP